MDWKQVRKLVEDLSELLRPRPGSEGLEEIEVQEGDLRIRVRRGGAAAAPAAASAAAAAASSAGAADPAASGPPAAAPAAPAAAEDEGLTLVRSPIVGTFFAAPSPGAPDFVSAGESVEAGQVLCIVEAMKLMNEIEAEVAGQIVKRLVTNGQPVEYGQPLFSLRPRQAAGA